MEDDAALGGEYKVLEWSVVDYLKSWETHGLELNSSITFRTHLSMSCIDWVERECQQAIDYTSENVTYIKYILKSHIFGI